jgi:uncharacterized protein (DUF1015 family)
MRLYAFTGYRYTPAAGEPDVLGAPPFDQIDQGLGEELHAASPYQFSHLTRPEPGEEDDVYRHAAALHRQWLEGGQVVRDEAPALYPYVIRVADDTLRLGVAGLVGVEPEASGVIRPHEKTLDKPFADRLNLLRATEIDLEPVMFLSDDPGTLEALLEEDIADTDPLVVHRDRDGNTHELYRITDRRRIARYQDALEACSAAIADGHHRYKVGRTYAEEVQARPATGAGSKLAVLFSMRSPHLVIDPIHRGLPEAPDMASIHALLRQRRTVEVADGDALAAEVARVNRAEGPTLGVQKTGELPELWLMEPARMPAGTPPGADSLAVAHLHYVLLPSVGLPPEAALDGRVAYRSSAATLWKQVQEGALQLGLYLPPMTAEAFGRAISKGDLLPAKATRFLPKLASGLVWAGHDAELA